MKISGENKNKNKLSLYTFGAWAESWMARCGRLDARAAHNPNLKPERKETFFLGCRKTADAVRVEQHSAKWEGEKMKGERGVE